LNISARTLKQCSVLAILNLLLLAALAFSLFEGDQSYRQVIRAQALVTTADRLREALSNANSLVGQYSITHDPSIGERFETACSEVSARLKALDSLAQSDRQGAQSLTHVHTLIEESLDVLHQTRGSVDNTSADVVVFRARHLSRESKSLADQLKEALARLTGDAGKFDEKQLEHGPWQITVLALIILLFITGILQLSCITGCAWSNKE
jgi:CHASE3 domain sensor protein